MSDLTRRQLLQRGAAGGSVLTLPGLLAACGGGGGIKSPTKTAASTTQVKHVLKKTLNFSNWPYYMDTDKHKKHPSLEQFTKQYGVKVNYTEDINDNEQFFGKIEGPLSKGQGIGRDIIVMTDSGDIPAKLVQLGWVQKLDKTAIPNAKNIQDVLAHPSWDPNREHSLPWQTGMTGIGYDPHKVPGGEITSIEDLLTNKKLKGKVTLLTEMSDSIGLVMLAQGNDPAHTTDATFDKALARLKKAVDSGQIRQFTGNEYGAMLAKGDVWACMAWSGDIALLQPDHPDLKWNLADTGGMVWTDNMMIPLGGDVYTASVYMNYYYQPKVAAEVEAGVNYICPVKGADAVLRKSDPKTANNPLIFPTKQMLDNVHQMNFQALSNTAYKKKFQALIGA